MYEAVYPYPAGESTVARSAATASTYGYDGILVRASRDAEPAFDREAIATTYDVDVVSGTEIRTRDPSRASGLVGSLRRATTILIVRGGTAAMNRFAIRQDRVDVLVIPLDSEADFEFAMAGEAIDHDVHVAVDLGGVLRLADGPRIEALARLERLWRVLADRDVPYVVTGSPRSHLELRAPRELAAIGALCGMEPEAVRDGLRAWERIAVRNRKRQSGNRPAPGVEIREEDQHHSSRSESR